MIKFLDWYFFTLIICWWNEIYFIYKVMTFRIFTKKIIDQLTTGKVKDKSWNYKV